MIHIHNKNNKSNKFNVDALDVFYRAGDFITDGWFDWFIQKGEQYISPKFWNTMGYDPQLMEQSDKEWQKLIDKNDLSYFKEEYDKHVFTKGNHEFSIPARFLHKNGETKWFICKGKVIEWDKDNNSMPIRMIGTYTDITNFKKVQESFEKMNLAHEIIENIIDGASFDIIVEDATNKISSEWKNYESVFGEYKELEHQYYCVHEDCCKKECHCIKLYWENFFSKVSSSFHDTVLDKFLEYLDNRKNYFESEFLMETNCGEKWFRCIAYIFYYKDTTRVIGIFRNISPHKETEILYNEEKNKFELIFESSPIGKLITNAEGVVERSNHAATKFLGYSKEELMGEQIKELICSDEKYYDIPNESGLEETNANNFLEFKTKDGHIVCGLVKKTILHEIHSSSNQILHSIVDITDAKEKERENEKMLKELSQFVSIASHDLQEPLRQIYNYTELLKETSEGFNDQQKKYLDFILKGANKSSALIMDLLKFSRADKDNEDASKVEIIEIIHSTLESLSEYIREKNGEVVVQDKENFPIISVHRVKIEQLFLNLIQNALKYVDNTTPPKVDISCQHLADNHYLFKVKDNGIGIDPLYQEKIFNIFERLSADYEGTGIGLAICKKTVEFHGGNIWVESNEDRGCTFCFTLKDFFNSSEK